MPRAAKSAAEGGVEVLPAAQAMTAFTAEAMASMSATLSTWAGKDCPITLLSRLWAEPPLDMAAAVVAPMAA